MFFFFFLLNNETFAMQKLLTFFQQKCWRISDIDVWNFNEKLTNDVVSFEQPDPGLFRVNDEDGKGEGSIRG